MLFYNFLTFLHFSAYFCFFAIFAHFSFLFFFIIFAFRFLSYLAPYFSELMNFYFIFHKRSAFFNILQNIFKINAFFFQFPQFSTIVCIFLLTFWHFCSFLFSFDFIMFGQSVIKTIPFLLHFHNFLHLPFIFQNFFLQFSQFSAFPYMLFVTIFAFLIIFIFFCLLSCLSHQFSKLITFYFIFQNFLLFLAFSPSFFKINAFFPTISTIFCISLYIFGYVFAFLLIFVLFPFLLVLFHFYH